MNAAEKLALCKKTLNNVRTILNGMPECAEGTIELPEWATLLVRSVVEQIEVTLDVCGADLQYAVSDAESTPRKAEPSIKSVESKMDDSGYVEISKVPPADDNRCILGRTTCDGCEHFEKGKCNGIVHPTYPPKLADCPFAKNNN